MDRLLEPIKATRINFILNGVSQLFFEFYGFLTLTQVFNNVKYVINSFYSLSYADDTIFALSWLDIKIEEFFFANRFNRR